MSMFCITEALEMNDFPFPEETDDVVDVRIIADAQNVIIGDTSLLLWHSDFKGKENFKKSWNNVLFPTYVEEFIRLSIMG